MALQSSGAISIADIRNEQVNNGGFSSSYSLRQLSSNAGKSTPDAISEFYGYGAAVTVNIDVYLPSYVGCANYYTFAAQSSATVNTNVNVGINWYGDLGGFFSGSVTIPSGAACNSASVFSGSGVNCIGEVRVNEFWSMFPTTSGAQNYFPNAVYSDIVPC
jgi:hypothetical protein